CVFIYPPETDVGSEIFVVLAGQFAGFATGATTGINKKSILGCHRLLLTPFQKKKKNNKKKKKKKKKIAK
ncbi:hypothetical protein K801_00010, partial [Salmonella enterica subsp. enterica serovar Newport str. SHSN011]